LWEVPTGLRKLKRRPRPNIRTVEHVFVALVRLKIPKREI
jgi:hypothetical protein